MLNHVDELSQGDPEQALAGDYPELQQEFKVNRTHIKDLGGKNVRVNVPNYSTQER